MTRTSDDASRFLEYVAENYGYLVGHLKAFCLNQHYPWSQDIFHDTILKCHRAIQGKGRLNDPTEKGMENYLFISYKLNSMRSRQYSSVTKREELGKKAFLKAWYDFVADATGTEEKVADDMFVDFAAVYLSGRAEREALGGGDLSPEEFNLWRMKTFIPRMTYSDLKEKTGARGIRGKVTKVRRWLKDHVSREEVDAAFSDMFNEFKPND